MFSTSDVAGVSCDLCYLALDDRSCTNCAPSGLDALRMQLIDGRIMARYYS